MSLRLPIVFPFLLVIFLLIISSVITSFGRDLITSSYVSKSIKDFSAKNFVYLMGLEFSQVPNVLPKESKPPKLSTLVFNTATNLKPGDIRSLLGRELPGFYSYDAEILFAGDGTDYTNLPIESSPPMEELLKESEINEDNVKTEDPNPDTTPPKMTTNGKKVVYIYQSHSYESFKPLLKNGADDSNNEKVNVIAVGTKLAEELEERGIGVIHDKTNMTEALHVKNLTPDSAYSVSRSIVATAMAKNKDVTNIIDIHRDSQPRNITTAKINGKSYARIMFVVGKEVKNFEKNFAFAKKLNDKLEEKYPGISRGGVYLKGYEEGNGKYNQDLAQNGILVEMGGVDNNLDELYRTAGALAEVYSDFYWEAEKVSTDKKQPRQYSKLMRLFF